MSDQHLEPGAPEYVQELTEQVANVRDVIAGLIRAYSTAAEEREMSYPLGGNTDGTGFLQVYVEIPQGFVFKPTRINLEAFNNVAGHSYTPAAPYAAGWVGFFDGEPTFGSLFDFAPPSPGANVFPQISVDGDTSARLIRSQRMCMQVNGGPANSAVHALITGRLKRL